jgi:hypothetical protein
MSCKFCEKIDHINDVEKNAQHSNCFLFKDSVSNAGFGMCIDGVIYGIGINFCPNCGRKLLEDNT